MQEFGVQLLVRQDNIAKNLREEREVGLAMVASGRMRPADAFPDEFMETVEAVEGVPDLNDPEAEYDYSAVEWESPEGMMPEDLAELDEFLQEVSVPTPAIGPGDWA